MKLILLIITILASGLSHSEIKDSDFKIKEVQVRSANFYSEEWENGVTLLLDPKISIDNCNLDRAYFDASIDSNLLAAALSAHAQKATVSVVINSESRRGDICKVEIISLKQIEHVDLEASKKPS